MSTQQQVQLFYSGAKETLNRSPMGPTKNITPNPKPTWYSKTSVARTGLRPLKLLPVIGSSSQPEQVPIQTTLGTVVLNVKYHVIPHREEVSSLPADVLEAILIKFNV